MQAKGLEVSRIENGLRVTCTMGLSKEECGALLRSKGVAHFINGYQIQSIPNGFEVLGSPNMKITQLQAVINEYLAPTEAPTW